MAKKDNNNLMLFGIIAVAIFFIFNNSGSSDNAATNAEGDSLLLSVTPSNPCLGALITGSVTSSLHNQQCTLEFKKGILAWQNLATISLDSEGKASEKTTATTTGEISLRVVCPSLTSNEKKINVIDCSQAQPQQNQPVCTDSDGGQDDQQFIKGTVTYDGFTYVDQCDWGNGGLTEYYCDGTAKMYNFQCENYWTCQEGKCAQQLCEDIMNPTMEKCAAGYTTDGGTCAFWSINNNPQCISSFNID